MSALDGETPGEEALREAIAEHGEDFAAALEHADHVKDLLDTAILVIASADEDEVERVTESLTSLIAAGDALSTEETAALAGAVGDNADDLAGALETLVRLERNGTLDEFAALAETASALELDEESVRGLNRLLGAVGEAERDPEPVGFLGVLRAARTPDVRAGLGYLLGVVRSLGNRR